MDSFYALLEFIVLSIIVYRLCLHRDFSHLWDVIYQQMQTMVTDIKVAAPTTDPATTTFRSSLLPVT